ncbi:hypothetical protein SAMN05421882_11154 [Nitrosomonas communis]|uniref:Uncharacterized protein n=1 Tax=Nitrosomonas communis TaxID=44574 RepID=A0A1H3A5X4_9PROT|nr:hypothetical protein SAMN05421882_11154 [Nitrosomonas communis]
MFEVILFYFIIMMAYFLQSLLAVLYPSVAHADISASVIIAVITVVTDVATTRAPMLGVISPHHGLQVIFLKPF